MGRLKILLLEDSELDAELTLSHLRKGGVEFDLDRADTRDGFLAALERGDHDIILADYVLPDFDGISALALARERRPETPFVFVSGGLGEELAIDLLRKGAVDYVLKSRLDRLVPAVRRAVEEARERTARRRAEEALREVNETLERRVVERTAQLRRLTAELTQTEHRERRRLAQILHDHLQQVLVAAKFQLDIARRSKPERLDRSMARLDELVSESIDISRSLTVELSPPVLYEASFGAALSWLVDWFGQKHGLDVQVMAEDGCDIDPEDLRIAVFSAVRELLFNVVKHAGVDNAELHLRRVDDGHVAVIVEDHGNGFDLAQKRQSATGGSFGLFNVEERLGFLGCGFELDSHPQNGTTATIVVPCGKRPSGRVSAPSASDGPASTVRQEANDGRVRVLLVDDHKVLREGLAGLLEQQNDIRVVGQASDGEQALEAIAQLHPDVVVMDITMPRMDGIEATRRATARWPHLAVIGLSMHSEATMSETMRQAGACHFLTKGGPVEDVVAAIRQCARRSERAAAPSRETASAG